VRDIVVSARVGWRDPSLALPAFKVRRMSREAFAGWVADNHNRVWEYPWVLDQVARWGLAASPRAADFGAGKSPVPLGLNHLGFATSVVDPDSEPVLGRRYGNEWDYVDYAAWGIETTKAGMEDRVFAAGSLGVAVSVSVVEHMPASVRRRAIAELARVVEVQGVVVLTVDVLPGGSRQLWNRIIDEIEPFSAHGTVDDVIEECAANGLELLHSERCPIDEGSTSVVGLVLRKVPVEL
jgi:SAM-dependent methyltransferase